MQDFTKVAESVQKSVGDSNRPTEVTLNENISFKNKDNFWNLMFVLGMLIGSMTIGMMFAIVIMAFVLNRFNGVTVKENKIFNSQGKEIDIKQVPTLGWTVACTVVVLLIIVSIFNTELKHTNELVGSVIFGLLIYGIPAFLFILKNCPISIYFNPKVWSIPSVDGGANYHRSNHFSSSNCSTYKASDTATNPRYSSLETNIFHSSKRDHFK